MCGGVGSRFWPFSRANMPKQFLDFFGTGRSLLQMTVDRVSTLVDKDHIVLVTNEAYADMIREQLPDIKPSNILLEPARRNTAPCICWATHHIYALDKEASIMTLPSDHLILKEMAFVKAMDEGMTFVENNNGLLTLGIMPTSPETGYGYIQKGTKVDGSDDTMKVKSFTEKPNLEMAKMLIATGEFFWNSGIFLWKAQTILDAFQNTLPRLQPTSIWDSHTTAPTKSNSLSMRNLSTHQASPSTMPSWRRPTTCLSRQSTLAGATSEHGKHSTRHLLATSTAMSLKTVSCSAQIVKARSSQLKATK